MPDPQAPRLLLVGYYGFGNDGDAWLLHKTVQILRDRYPDAALCALYNPAHIPHKRAVPFESSSVLKEMTFVNRWNPWAILKALVSSSAVVCGGGSLFQDKSSKQSLIYYALILIVARLLGKKRLLLGQGLGPLYFPLSRRLVRLALGGATLCVRDEHSAALVQELNPKQPVILSADLVYYKAVFQPDRKATQKAPLIGLCLSPTDDDRLTALAAGLAAVPQDYLFLMGDAWQDEVLSWKHEDLSGKIVDRLAVLSAKKTDHRHSPLDRHTIKWVVTMRYHVAVWASLRHIPFLALSEDPKLTALAESLGQPLVDITLPTEILAQYVATATLDLIDRHDYFQAQIIEKTPLLVERAQAVCQGLSLTSNS